MIDTSPGLVHRTAVIPKLLRFGYWQTSQIHTLLLKPQNTIKALNHA